MQALCRAKVFADYMISVWCSMRRLLLLVLIASCLFTVLFMVFFLVKISLSIEKPIDAIKKELRLVQRHGLVAAWHNYSTGSIYCSETICQAVSDKPHDVDRISSGMVASSHNTSLVLLGKLSTKTNGSLKYMNNQFADTVSFSSLSGNVSQILFRSRQLVIWSADHHPAPAYDARTLLEPLGITFLQHDLSPYCSLFNLCAERHNLKVSCVL